MWTTSASTQKKLIADMKAYKNAPSTACPSPDEYAALMEKKRGELCGDALRQAVRQL